MMQPTTNRPVTKAPAFRSWATHSAALVFALLAACDGGKSSGSLSNQSSKPELQRLEMGRLVDVYAYQRIDESVGDRRRRFNRRLQFGQRRYRSGRLSPYHNGRLGMCWAGR